MENEYLERYRASGETSDLEALYGPYRVKVFRMCMHYLKNAQESEKAVVEIFRELQQKVMTYETETFNSWLYTLARNHCLKKLRNRTRTLFAADIFTADDSIANEGSNDISRWIERLPDAIESLDDCQRWSIVLFYLHGMSFREIARERDCSMQEVRAALKEGGVKLKRILQS